MLKTLGFILKLRNCYRANNVIFILRSLPFAKKILPQTLYANKAIKALANIIAAITELVSVFLGKLIYFVFMFFMLDYIYLEFGVNIDFLHTFIFFTIAGVFANNRFDNATKDSYYAVFLMKVSARSYALTEMTYFLTKMLVGFAAFAFLSKVFVGVSTAEAILMPVFVVCAKIVTMPLLMKYSQSYSKALGRNYLLILIALVVAIIGLATGGFGLNIQENIFYILSAAVFAGAVFALSYIYKYPHFKEFYRKLFVTDIQLFAYDNNKVKADVLKQGYSKQITDSTDIKSSKKGFAYFNDLFVKRHRKTLTRSAIIIAAIAFIISVALCVYCAVDLTFSAQINSFMSLNLTYLLFIMYFVNCGNRATAVMFANCDNKMLYYGFYRKPSSLIKNFGNRLISVVKINLIPGGVLALAFPVILYVSGGAETPMHYVITVACTLAMSVFFSVHSMVLYYLLQPYNQNMELKSPLFSIINTATYFVCFFAMGREIPIFNAGVFIIAFCLIYILVALILAYKLAPKTFKLRK